jgi:hypothetical protein
MKKVSYIVIATAMMMASTAQAQRANTTSRAGVNRAAVTRANVVTTNTTSNVAKPTSVVTEEIRATISAPDINYIQLMQNMETEQVKLQELADKQALRDQLLLEISQIESEQDRCEKQKRNWTTATVIGGIGTVAGGVGAILQGKDIKEKKEDLNSLR